MRHASPLLLLGLFACADSGRDDFAARDAVRQLKSFTSEPPCEGRIEVYRDRREVLRDYRQVALLSATCSPGSPRVCEDELMRRACQLDAEALIYEPTTYASGPGQTDFTLTSRAARAVRWR